MLKLQNLFTGLLLGLACFTIFAQDIELAPVASAPEKQTLADEMESLQQQLIKLNRDLFILEEDLLFPSSTQLAVYLSVDAGQMFRLDAVELKINNESVTHYLYTDRQIDALSRGGVQRLYIGNVNQGEHELSAFLIGMGPENRQYKRAVSATINKDSDAKAVELQILDNSSTEQPDFRFIEL